MKPNYTVINQRALDAAKALKYCESELIKAIQNIDKNKVYFHFGLNSLFKYCLDILDMTDHQAYTYINLARKANDCQQLQK